MGCIHLSYSISVFTCSVKAAVPFNDQRHIFGHLFTVNILILQNPFMVLEIRPDSLSVEAVIGDKCQSWELFLSGVFCNNNLTPVIGLEIKAEPPTQQIQQVQGKLFNVLI